MLCLGDYYPVDNVYSYSAALRSDEAPLTDPQSMDGDVTSSPALMSSSSNDAELREIHRCVRFMMGKMAADDSYSNVNQEWEELARVLDRCLFLTFLILYIITLVALLL
jgi:hypothetical protein